MEASNEISAGIAPEHSAFADPRASQPWFNTRTYYKPSHLGDHLFNIASKITLQCTIWIARAFLLTQNVEVINLRSLEATYRRSPGVPLITVSNHQATLDDPILFAALLPKMPPQNRWTIGANEICYKNWFLGLYCSFCQVLPIIRGNGIWQPMMDQTVDRLSRPTDNWVHIFPEGRVSQEDKLLRFKWGVGRLVADPRETPIVLPIYIEGTKDILREGRRFRWLPGMGCNLTVRVGEPIDFSDIVRQAKQEAMESYRKGQPVDRIKTYRIITEKIQKAVEELKINL